MEQWTLFIPSLGCQGCMNKIVRQLQTLPGIEIEETDVPTKTLSLQYNSQEVSQERIEQTIREIGHRIETREEKPAGKGI
jgi:copper chaperone CopZ